LLSVLSSIFPRSGCERQGVFNYRRRVKAAVFQHHWINETYPLIDFSALVEELKIVLEMLLSNISLDNKINPNY